MASIALPPLLLHKYMFFSHYVGILNTRGRHDQRGSSLKTPLIIFYDFELLMTRINVAEHLLHLAAAQA